MDQESSIRGDGGRVLTNSFSHQCILQGAVQTSLGKHLDTKGPIASQGGSVPVFLRKPIATCEFFLGGGGGGGSGPPVPPLDPPMEILIMLTNQVAHF